MIAKKQYNVSWGQIISSVGSIKEDWIQHVFFFCLGAAMFGIGYAALPILVLLIWILHHFFSRKGFKFIKTLTDGESWLQRIWFYYLLFLIVVFVSDLINSGDWNHRDSFLVNLFIGFFILAGCLVVNNCKAGLERAIVNYWRWAVFWNFLILLLVELRYRRIFFFHDGVFDNVNKLFLAVAFLGIVNWALFLEKAKEKDVLPWLSGVLALCSGISILKYSTSDILPALYVFVCFLVCLFSRSRISMLILPLGSLCAAFYVVFSKGILAKMGSANFIKVAFWRHLLNHREEVWTVTSRMFVEHPLWGVGSGNFGKSYRAILEGAKDLPHGIKVYDHSHSIWLHHFVSHGVFAGMFFCIFLFYVVSFVMFMCSKKGTILGISLAVLGVFALLLIYGIVEFAGLFEGTIPFVWGSLGILIGCSLSLEKEVNA